MNLLTNEEKVQNIANVMPGNTLEQPATHVPQKHIILPVKIYALKRKGNGKIPPKHYLAAQRNTKVQQRVAKRTFAMGGPEKGY